MQNNYNANKSTLAYCIAQNYCINIGASLMLIYNFIKQDPIIISVHCTYVQYTVHILV